MGTPQSGRLMQIEIPDPDGDGNTFIPVAGARENSLTIENGESDASDKDNEWRELTNGATRSFNTSVSGVYESDDTTAAEFVRRAIENVIAPMRVVFANGESFEGVMQIGSYERTGAKDESTMFSCDIKSAGEITYTPPTVA